MPTKSNYTTSEIMAQLLHIEELEALAWEMKTATGTIMAWQEVLKQESVLYLMLQ